MLANDSDTDNNKIGRNDPKISARGWSTFEPFPPNHRLQQV